MSWINRTKNALDRVKYFGLRFFYYRIFKKNFPHADAYILDIINPTLTSRYLSKKIIKEYWGYIGHGVEESDSYLGLGLIHYSLIRILKTKKVLCVGSYRGFIPVICALACRDNKKGVVDFIDAGLDLSTIHPTFGDGYWKKTDPVKHFKKVVKTKYLNTHVMTNKDFVRKFPKRNFGYIYIDGDHTYKGVKTDYQLFWPRLEKGGFMVFHDVLGKGDKIQFGVKKLWEELSDVNKIIIPFPAISGLGIMQKN
jgi:hypothetical protein